MDARVVLADVAGIDQQSQHTYQACADWVGGEGMNWTMVGLVVACTTSVALGGALVASVMGAQAFFEDRSQLRLRPIDPGHFADENRNLPPPTQRRLIVFGDSRASQMIVKQSAGADWQPLNRGVSGESSVQSSYRFKSDVTDLQPSATLIITGINDLVAAANLPWMEVEAVANLKANIARFARDATANGGIAVISTIVRPTRPRLIRRPFWSDRVYDLILEVNQYVRSLASDTVLVLDADAILVGTGDALADDFATDEVHLNKKANEILDRHLSPLINR